MQRLYTLGDCKIDVASNYNIISWGITFSVVKVMLINWLLKIGTIQTNLNTKQVLPKVGKSVVDFPYIHFPPDILCHSYSVLISLPSGTKANQVI